MRGAAGRHVERGSRGELGRPLPVLEREPPAQDEAHFSIATTRKIYHVTFRRIGAEKITLPFGDVDTEIWKRVDGDGAIEAQVWLAPSLRYVAVKLRLSNARATVEGLLDSIRVDDTVAQR